MIACGAATAAERQRVDLELVLAVDNSLSVNQREYNLQIKGIADGFRDPDVVNAILSRDGVAVSILLWSNHKQQETGVGWTLLDNIETIAAFADRVAAVPRIEVSGGTGLGSALAYALRSIDTNRFAGQRRVIDISGDGQNNMGVSPAQIRDAAVAASVTVNGLAILDEEPWLDRYYTSNVIGGPGAFLEVADDFDSFARAMRRKLRREIGKSPVASR